MLYIHIARLTEKPSEKKRTNKQDCGANGQTKACYYSWECAKKTGHSEVEENKQQ